jgi:WD40 repeat protein
MGAVLRGHDPELGRDVAVKVLLEKHRGRPEMVRRFLEEVQISGQLQHPGVAPVYALGRTGDHTPYFTMKLVKGRTLADLLAASPDRARERGRFVGIFGQVCQTLAYAHSRGVIHRDLKPANVMVGAFGEVQVMDWGLAKVLAESGAGGGEPTGPSEWRSTIRTRRGAGLDTPGDEGGLTEAGTVLGTAAYMAPEQARGEVELVDERADVFGLGGILCEVLTGRPPFPGKVAEAQRRAQTASLAEAYAALDGCGADADLVALAKRCLAAEPWHRPRDAGAVAAELTAYQESVEARLRRAELEGAQARVKAQEERKRRKLAGVLAGLAVLLVLVSLAGFAAVSWQWQRAEGEFQRAEGEFQKAADLAEARGRAAYALSISLAYADWRAGNAGRAEQMLDECRPELCGWEWHYLRRLFRVRQLATREAHARGVLAVAFSPDGARVASAGADGIVKVWRRRDLRRALTLRGHTAAVRAVVFSPDGRRLASGGADGTVRVWDAAHGKELARWPAHKAGVTGLAFDPKGRRLASTGGEPGKGEMKLWNATTGKALVARIWHHLQEAVAFSPNGKFLATACAEGIVALWDAATLNPVRTFQSQQRPIVPWTSVAFSANGQWVAAGSPDRLVRVWDAATAREYFSTLTPTKAGVSGIAFCGRDGRIFVAASLDNTILGWYTKSGIPAFTLRGHRGVVTAVAGSPDGRRLVSGSLDRTVKLWDLTRRNDDLTFQPGNEGVTGVAFSPDGRRLAGASRDRTVKVWDIATRDTLFRVVPLPAPVQSLAFRPDGGQLAAAGGDGTVRLWEVPAGRKRRCLRGHRGPVRAVAFRPDGRRLASAGEDGITRVWEVATGRQVRALHGRGGPVHTVAFSPDGKHLATAGQDGVARVWEADTGQGVLLLDGRGGPVHAVTYGPKGRHLTTAGQDGVVRVWDAATGELTRTMRGHAGAVRGLAYGPKGRLASVGDDRAVRLWDRAGQELLALRGHTAPLRAVAFSPDGHRLASASDDGKIKVWDGTPLEGARGGGE